MEYFTFKNYDWFCNNFKLKKSLVSSLIRFRDFCLDLAEYYGGRLWVKETHIKEVEKQL